MKNSNDKFLFVFPLHKGTIEVFAKDMMEAQEKVCRILGIHECGQPFYTTENWDCPRCRHVAQDCNYPL